MIPQSIAEKILLIGPDYKNHRGGIGAIIGIHKDQYEVYNFIPSFKPYKNNLFKSLYFIKQFVKISFQLVRNRQIRIVHIHSSKRGSLYRKLVVACLAKLIFGKKTINHIHTGNFKRFYDNSNALSKKIICFFLKMNDVTITVSDSWKTYFETSFHLKNVYKINNIITRMPANECCITACKNGFVNFLFLGLIDVNKGIFDLLKVIANNKDVLSNKLRLVIGGNGQVNLLNETIATDQLEELVEYRGWVSGAEKHELLQNADVFVLPSYYEGVPVAILEAMSYGKPVISTTVGGIPELVQSSLNGWLVKPGDHMALLNAILFYVNEHENISKHGAWSLHIIKNYYPETIVPQLEDVYCSLL